MALEKDFRTSHSPSPIYGDGSLRMNPRSKGQGLLRPGFTVGDLDKSYLFSGISTSKPHNVYNAQTGNDSSGTTASPGARLIKAIVTINSGTGSVDITMKSNSDTYTATVFDSGALSGVKVFEFYIGGWASPTDGDGGYQATQYGPVVAGQTPDKGNTTGDEEPVSTGHANPASEQNFSGGVYNPTNFLSLGGYDVKFFASVTGTVNYSLDIIPVN